MQFFKSSSLITGTKLNLRLGLIKHQSMKMYRGDEVQIHASLATEVKGNEWPGPRLCRCPPPPLLQLRLLNLKNLTSRVCSYTCVRSTHIYSK